VTLTGFAFDNLLRRPARTTLTVFAIALGIAAVVALTAISWGFEDSWQRANDARGTDLIVTRQASENTLPSAFVEEEPRRVLEGLPHVRAVVGLLSMLLSVTDTAPPAFVFGWAYHSYLWDHLRLVDGRWPASDDEPVAMIGSTAAAVLARHTGDTIDIEGKPFRIAGVFESTALVENGAIVLTLTQAQAVTDRPGKVNVLNLKLDPAASPEDLESLKQAVHERLPGYAAISSAELVRSNAVVRISKAMSAATVLIAGLVSALVVFNTMLMSISERTREIGVLLALG
jgi:putative ABC transport system permease protein